MKKRLATLVVAGTMTMSLLTGCGHEHTWADATCTTPKTCTECGETEGEVLEHTWIEATCAEPKHCSVCGVTEGEALEHTWTEATYWEAKTCSVCGATEGEPVTPSFVEHGVSVIDITVGAEYDYVMACSTDKSKETVGKLTITDYQIADTYEGYETPEGYEWQIVKASVWAGDDNANNYGSSYNVTWGEYYDSDFEKEFSSRDLDDVYTINYLGEEYTECLDVIDGKWLGWVDCGDHYEDTADITLAFRVPKGYDGRIFVFGKYNGSKNWNEYLDEDALAFRLK